MCDEHAQEEQECSPSHGAVSSGTRPKIKIYITQRFALKYFIYKFEPIFQNDFSF